MIEKYLLSRYRSGGRGEAVGATTVYDCWGLSRAVRAEVYGRPLLPAFADVAAQDKAGMTRCGAQVAADMQPCNPRPGALAAVYRGRLLIHVAICVEDGMVLEVGRPKPRLVPIGVFEANYAHREVAYYD